MSTPNITVLIRPVIRPVIRTVCVLLAIATHSSWAAKLPDLIEKISPSVVGIGTAYPPRQPNLKGDRITYAGTGFVVGNGRQIITNVHVLPTNLDTDNNQTLAVFAGKGRAAKALVAREVRRDEDHDLVLLEIKAGPLPALQLGDSDTVRAGQEVGFTGFPIGMALGLYPATHKGIVAAVTPMAQPLERARELSSVQVRRMRQGFLAFQLDAIAYPGNSGSPVFELDTGLVVGVINSVVVKESRETMLAQPSGISYAIPAKYVTRLLAGSD